jgi:hypothetical protein
MDSIANTSAVGELIINRLLKQSYGVNARVLFENGKHDPNHKKEDFEGVDWCDDIILWMAYKVCPDLRVP